MNVLGIDLLLFGRFTGAFIAGALAFASVPLAILLGSMMPWLDQAKVGPLRPEDYLYAYFLIALPTMFVTAGRLPSCFLPSPVRATSTIPCF